MISKRIFIILFLIFFHPLYALDTDLLNEKRSYCKKWADRFLSIKDGKNYKENKISSKKFQMYFEICLQNYDELRQYYENLQKQNQIKKEKIK